MCFSILLIFDLSLFYYIKREGEIALFPKNAWRERGGERERDLTNMNTYFVVCINSFVINSNKLPGNLFYRAWT